MKVRNLGETNSIANQYLADLRDPQKQTNRLLFRLNVARLGEIMAYEISKELNYNSEIISTTLGNKVMHLPSTKDVVLLTILRAGIPFLEGFQRIFDQAGTGFVGAFREEGQEEVRIKAGYFAVPDLTGKQVVLLDPMLATGKSVVEVLQLLKGHGKPAHLFLASVIAAPEGIKFLSENVKGPASLLTFAIDEKLNDNFYIVPGLGDAGDLSFGEK